jgi:hypothetical protein
MPTAILIWIWFCAYLNCAGWTLSALHQLNAAGYTVALLIGFGALVAWRKQTSERIFPQIYWRRLNRRFRRPLPLAFLALAAMACLGGVLYAPSNYDALAYRLPRILHWLAAGQWHWIHTIYPRLNQRCCGVEWVSAPFLVLLKTDRLLFLINVVSFLLLPGLVFGVFTRLGVRRRVAWHWMWLVPTGYCFVLQAGSIGSDLFGTVFVLAAMDFALRGKVSGSARDFFASALAAALMTSAKPSNLPLLLPWAAAMLPSTRLILRWPMRTAAVGIVALAASFLPTAALNWHYCGDWTGLKVETGGGAHAPFFLTGVNTFLLGIQNFNLPVFPFNGWWHEFFVRHLPSALAARLDQIMEVGLRTFDLDMLQIEEHAGLGFGVCALLLASFVAARFAEPEHSRRRPSVWLLAVRWLPVVSLLALMSQSNLAAISREIAPYYSLLLPQFLTSAGHEQLVMRRWWRRLAFVVFILAAMLLIVSPARPLFPVGVFLGKVHAAAAQHPVLKRVETVYSVYRNRSDGFAPVRAGLPPEVKILGLIAYDDPETSLWRPFGSRRIEHVCPPDTAADLKRRGMEYVLVQEEVLKVWFKCSLDDWLGQMNAQVVQKIPLSLRASKGALDWYLVRLR